MKPSELYARKPERIDKDISCLSLYRGSHVPALEPLYNYDLTKNERITVRYYKDHHFDYRRFWRLASVWLDDRPVMVIQNAGREGDDFHCTYVTDHDAYGEMIGYIATFIKPPRAENPKGNDEFKYVSADQDVPGLVEFYYQHMDTVGYDW